MIKTLLKQIGEYKKDTIITPIFTILEVVAEPLVPFVIASLIDKGIEARDLRNVYLYGALMIVLAFFGLVFGILAGRSRLPLLPVLPATCARVCLKTSRPFPFPTLTNSVRRALLPA